MQNATNRRGALAALAKATAGVTALGVACSVSQCASPAHGATIDRTAWNTAFARMVKAREAYEAYKPTCAAAYEGFKRDAPSGDGINMRDLSPLITPMERANILYSVDLDKLHADYIAAHKVSWWAPDPDAMIARHKASCEEVRRFRAEREAVKIRHNYDAVSARDEELAEAAYDASWALFDIPAPDLAALRFKLEHLFGDGAKEGGEGAEPWAQHVMAGVMADIRRLLPKEA